MALDVNQLKKEIQEPRKRTTIQKAIAHQNRIKFHAQTRITPYISQPLTDFLTWVEGLIPADKARIFKQLFRYPVKTNEVTNICFDKLSRVFDGRNPAFNYQFYNTEQRDDWEYYRQDILKEPNIWQNIGWEFFKTEINSVLIVDLPELQTSEYPEPYFYWLPIDRVITYEVNPVTGIMDWIIFRQDGDKIAVFDDNSFRTFRMLPGGQLGELISEAPHDLGYCPARFFWNEPLNLQEPDIKNHPLSKELSALDWFLFFHVSKHHLDLYGSYPIYSGYERSCDYNNSENGDECHGGFIKDLNGGYRLDAAGALLKCPKCGDHRINGAGTFVEIPAPDEQGGIPDMRNPVQMLSVDATSLTYNVEEESRLKTEIITAVVGLDNGVVADQALNEMQVGATFENQSTILNRIKKGFEEAQNFVDETVCRLRYGTAFISAKINLGTEFYVMTPKILRDQYRIAKEAGASEAELDALQNQIIETEYRHNPTQLQRMLILSDLEPYRHFSRAEVMDLYSKKLISEEDFRIKINFSTFVKRFERENTNILEFGTATTYENKIRTIIEKFKQYATEIQQSLDRDGNNGGQLPGTQRGGNPVPRETGSQTV